MIGICHISNSVCYHGLHAELLADDFVGLYELCVFLLCLDCLININKYTSPEWLYIYVTIYIDWLYINILLTTDDNILLVPSPLPYNSCLKMGKTRPKLWLYT